MKRLVIVSDLHCGHFSGLTPPAWQVSEDRNPHLAKLQRACWDFYVRTIRQLQPIDILMCNGDAIDGKASRSGATELIVPSLMEQAEMATFALGIAKAKRYALTYGTPYHVSAEGEDIERMIADDLAGTIGGHEWVDCEGHVFDFKHKVGSSQLEHGRFTAAAKEFSWNAYWNEIGGAPKASVFVRSHVHYFGACRNSRAQAITTPALQGPGSKYGVRQCSGVVDFGLISFDCEKGVRPVCKEHLFPVRVAAPEPIRA